MFSLIKNARDKRTMYRAVEEETDKMLARVIEKTDALAHKLRNGGGTAIAAALTTIADKS